MSASTLFLWQADFMKTNSIVIYCDGACSGNPGPGGWGSIVILDQSPEQSLVKELGSGHPATTNNRMEMSAVIAALNYSCLLAAQNKIESIQIFTDSVYVIRGITQWIHGWKRRGWKNAENEEVSNKDLWIDLDKAVAAVKPEISGQIEWNFVKGHSGIAGNERCDEIAVAFSKNNYIDLYEGSAGGYVFDVTQLPEKKPLPEMKKKSGGASTPAWYLSYVNGVFSRHATWGECEAVVKGRPAKFKKVTSEAEEDAIKKSWGI